MAVLKNIFKIIAIFSIGMVGGIFADQIFWPYFIERPLFYQYRLEQTPIYVTEKKEIHIQENLALQEAIEKVEKVVVGVKTKTEAEILEGSGLTVTSDGLIITLANLLPRGSDFYFWVNGKWSGYQVLKRDLKNNLALVKIEQTNLSTTGFAEFDKLRVGERVFLIGLIPPSARDKKAAQKIVNEGIIKSVNENLIQTNILETENISGSPLFDIEGNVVGLIFIEDGGRVNAIPIKKIQKFLGF